ncbi:hypothetical protein [Microbacterium sp.]|uniref:DUF6993 domain-containing protein n=1 Tax=Microbacterium sp. TaxID=51671 RepID=UPI0026002C68|nr:hypothetical protein [Microbacterium sp.]
MFRARSTAAAQAPLVTAGALLLALTLAACAPAGSARPSASSGPSGTGGASAPTTAAPAPQLVPGGTADENLPLFRAVTERVWGSEQRESGRAYIDALAAAGFDRGAMQVTEDRSTVDNPAESIQFSVRWGDASCLVGQVGPSTGDPVTAVLPQLDGGACLVGKTAPVGP